MSTAVSEGRFGCAEQDPHPPEEQVLPVLAEKLSVTRRRIETGGVRASVTTRHQEQIIEEDLLHERVEVERVPIGRIVDAMPPVREDGTTTIIPVVEEVLVIERRLILKEEVHIRRITVRETHLETVVTRAQDVVVTRYEHDPRKPAEPGLDDHSHPDVSSQKDP